MRVLLIQGALMPEQMAHWEAAQQLGVDLHVACGPPQMSGEASEPQLNLEIHAFEPLGWVSRGHLWWLYPGLSALVKSLQPDVIHVTAETYGLFYSQLDLRRYRVAGHVVDNLWTHGSIIEREIRLRRASRILRRLRGLASWNEAGVELARRYGLGPDVPTVIVPGRIASSEPFRRASTARAEHRRLLGFGPEPVIGFLGRLVPEKGVDWLLESYAASSVTGSSTLRIYGSGPAEQVLRSRARDLGSEAVFGGSLPPNEVPGLLAAFDVLVVPSLTTPDWAEQFGRVIAEAMFAGTAVIASESGSIPEVVGNSGVLVAEGDRPGLTRAIEDVVLNTEHRESLAKAGCHWATERYGPDVLGTKINQFWQEIAQRS